MHSARWMARVLYYFKMWMFNDQFKLKPVLERGIFQFLLFVSNINIQTKFEAMIPVEAPANDLQFLHQLAAYKNLNLHDLYSGTYK